MKLYQKLLANLKIKACEVIDFDILPAYREKRDELFNSMGMPEIAVTTDPEDLEDPEVTEEVLDSDPLTQALEALNENLSSSVWVKQDDDPFNSTEYVIGGMVVQQAENKVNQFVVLLKDRFSEAQQPIPLYILLTNFRPLEQLDIQNYH